jgi:hypothetical protein
VLRRSSILNKSKWPNQNALTQGLSAMATEGLNVSIKRLPGFVVWICLMVGYGCHRAKSGLITGNTYRFFPFSRNAA